MPHAPDPWTPRPFERQDGTVPFQRFVDGLSDFKFVALDEAIKRLLSARGIDLVRTEWPKPLGGGLHEFRIRHDADEIARMFGNEPARHVPHAGPILLRVFVHFHGKRAIVLLNGYDKGRHPSKARQQREIAKARRLLAQFRRLDRRW